jgi:type IV pilus assembly protein PilM
MAGGHTHVIGLDIGSSTIKAVELRRSGSTIHVMGRPVAVPTPDKAVEGGVIVNSNAIASTIHDLLTRGGFHTKKVIASVGGDTSVVVRITEVPKMPAKELDEAVQWELDRQTPFPIDQTFYDYSVVHHPDADPNAQNMDVLLAVAQEDMVNAHVDTLQAAKLLPVAIDVEPTAIARALVETADGAYDDQTVCVLHIGRTLSMIIVVRKGLLSFVRTVPTGGEALTERVRQDFMNDAVRAEQVKRQFADLSDAAYDQGASGGSTAAPSDLMDAEDYDSVFEASDPASAVGASEPFSMAEAAATQLETEAAPQAVPAPVAPTAPATEAEALSPAEAQARQIVYESIAPTIVDLATEVRRSIDFYRRQHRNEEIDRLVLSGGSAIMNGLAQFVEAETGISTSVADPFAHLQADGDGSVKQYLTDIGPHMVIAVGLALRDMV